MFSQLLLPRNTLGPKSTMTVNNPFVTGTAVLVVGPPRRVPPVAAL